MKELFRHIFLVGILAFSFSLAKADVGETYDLRQERSKVLSEIKFLEDDTVNHHSEITVLYKRMRELDQAIFESYQETIDRESSRNINLVKNQQWVVYLAFIASLLTVFFAIMLFVVRKKIMDKGYSGLLAFYKDLTLDFAGQVSPDQTSSNRMLRVNIVVLVGLVIMGVSIISFLLSAF